MKHSQGQRHSPFHYRRARRWFWALLILSAITILLVALLVPVPKATGVHRYLTVGIAGCIPHQGIYRLPEGSDLAMLVQAAGGLSPRADARKVDLEYSLKNDSIYVIPCGEKDLKEVADLFLNTPPQTPVVQPPQQEEVINILYIGFPAVYFLIRYSVSHNTIHVTHLPHSTTFLDNEYRLVDIYFTMGIEPTLDILQKRLNQRIDYYYVQNKNSFIEMIDHLGGLQLEPDGVFAKTYSLESKPSLFDGRLTFEYLRFIDQNTYRPQGTSSSLESLELTLHNIELAYEQRQFRQKKVVSAIRQAIYQKSRTPEKIPELLRSTFEKGALEDNIDPVAALRLFRALLASTSISYGTLPGYYSKSGNNVYYIPAEPGFEMLRNQQLREMLNANKEDNKQILY
ncbi:MAG: hypothetical protein R6U64_07020 [Bacteroidales bacterium]